MTQTAQIEVLERQPKRELSQTLTPQPIAADANTALLQVIANAARDPQVDVAKMQALYAMHKDAVAEQARRAFAAAMSRFKANPPKITKNKHVKFETSKGVTEYDHATLGHANEEIIGGLAAVGISHRWDLDQLDGGVLKVTCVLTHSDGHETRTPLQHGREDSGGKNSIQGLGSTQSYLERYTLLAATGLAAGMPEDDGRNAEKVDCVSENEIANIQALIDEVGANKISFLRYLKVDQLGDIPAANYKYVVKLLEEKRKK